MSTCSVEGCSRELRSSGADYCNTHYFRWYRTGDTGPAEIWDRKPKQCKVDDCSIKSFSLELCEKHYQRFRAHGDPTYVSPPRTGAMHSMWKNREVGYTAAHDRVRSNRGSATEYDCVTCGESAKQWAYDHADPDELHHGDYPYSPDTQHYQPMCVPCHVKFDREQSRLSKVLIHT